MFIFIISRSVVISPSFFRVGAWFIELGNGRLTYQNNPDQGTYAKALWERIRRECKHPIHITPISLSQPY